MVTLTPADQNIASIRTFLNEVPGDTALVTERETGYEHRFDVAPSSDRHCAFAVDVTSYGIYGLYVGRGLAFDDLPIEDFPPVQTVRALLMGQVNETRPVPAGWAQTRLIVPPWEAIRR